ncbi:MAG: hypothetical protein HZB55_09955 [Deltaproteobacteria bacterium]|nr:hypothetical protein [Deltaproteobacteria bacterium]
MFFASYRKLSQRKRALVDGQLITYHFYVGGVILVLLGLIDASKGSARSGLEVLIPGFVVAYGLLFVIAGVAFHLLHRHLIRGPQRDAYLATITAVLGRHRFPVLPTVLGTLLAFSLFTMALRLFLP